MNAPSIAQTVPTGQTAGDDPLWAAVVVRRYCGDVSEMTLWRWVNDPALCFPRPVKIAKRNYWHRSEILSFVASRKEGA